MAISSEYRLPGVYTTEIVGPRLSTTQTSAPIVAFVGPSIGYRSASQRITFTGTEEVSLDNTGVVADSYIVTGATSGERYVLNRDYDAVQDANGSTALKRRLTSLSTTKTSVSAQDHTFYSAQPTFIIKDPAEGHVIKGSVTVKTKDGSKTFVEGTDYSIDYYDNEFSVVVGTSIDNATELTLSYDWTTAEPIELTGEGAFTLTNRYIQRDGLTSGNSTITATIVCCTYTDSEGQKHNYGETPGLDSGTYIEGVDYMVDYDTGRIARTATSRIPSFDESIGNIMYAAFAYCRIKENDPVIASYRYIDEAYSKPHWYDSYNDVQTQYGAPWNDQTGARQSDLSAAVYIATQNGLGGCYCVSVPGVQTDTGIQYPLDSWRTALEDLTVVQNIDIVVPLSGDVSVWQLAKTHSISMRENEEERVIIAGADGTETPVDATSMVSLAHQMSAEYFWVVSPSTFLFRNPISNIVEKAPGWFAAAAVAGFENSVPQYTSLTHKTLNGFYGAAELNKTSTKRNECANGLMYIDETATGQMRILHGRTTDLTSIITQESNIVLTKYYILRTLRTMFSNGYIGNVITPGTLLNVKAAAQSTLSNMVASNYINSFTGLNVAQDSSNPTQVNIEFEYVPVYSINYIQISFSVDAMSTLSA